MNKLLRAAIFPLAFACYVVSFFLPVLSMTRFGGGGEDIIPGWMAAWDSAMFASGLFSLEIFDRRYWGSASDVRDEVIVPLMFAANIFMLLSPFLIYRVRPRLLRWSCFVFLVPVLSAFSPMLIPVLDHPREKWLAGYYAWVSSVAITYILVVVYGLSIRWSERAPARVAQL